MADLIDKDSDDRPVKIWADPSGRLYLRNKTGWSKIPDRQALRVLREKGFSTKPEIPGSNSAADSFLAEVSERYVADYIGPLAGFNEGVYSLGDKRVLVTCSPQYIEPKNSDWAALRAFLDLLFANPIHLQIFFTWLKCGLESLNGGFPWRPQQAMAFCGPKGSGKSLLQNVIITKCFGGRSAQVFSILSERTAFNLKMFWAEHLMIEDDVSSSDIRSRRKLGAMIKNIVSNEWREMHGKFKTAIDLCPFNLLTITLNDGADDLTVLPPLDESIAEKLIILRTGTGLRDTDLSDLTTRRNFVDSLQNGLPGFLYFLLNEFVVPEELRDPRYGIKAYHDPNILNALEVLDPKAMLIEMLEATPEVAAAPDKQWTTTELLKELECEHPGQARRLFKGSASLGKLLMRLASDSRHPGRVHSPRKGQWRINTCPSGENATVSIPAPVQPREAPPVLAPPMAANTTGDSDLDWEVGE